MVWGKFSLPMASIHPSHLSILSFRPSIQILSVPVLRNYMWQCLHMFRAYQPCIFKLCYILMCVGSLTKVIDPPLVDPPLWNNFFKPVPKFGYTIRECVIFVIIVIQMYLIPREDDMSVYKIKTHWATAKLANHSFSFYQCLRWPLLRPVL